MPSPSPPSTAARVYLVGAGPGDPGLITLRGMQCLARADVVLYDYLVNPQILEHAPPQAEFVCLGRHGHGRIMPQQEINDRMVRAARAGQTVVRLKAGDPAVFARAAEEVQALIASGIEFEIVPGITAALAAGSHAGISLTDRHLASAVALVTGHEQEGKPEPSLDYQALAKFPGTLVFYMGVTSAPHWTRALAAAGKPPDTPAAIVRRCSWPDQETVHCTLGTVVEELTRRKMRPPVIVIVGDVVRWDANAAWFSARPLSGKRIVVTRPQGQANDLRHNLQELGADVLLQPAIEISPPDDWGPVDTVLEQLDTYDWLVFSSANGVRYFLERLLFHADGDLRWLGRAKLAAIGPSTAEELMQFHLRADLMPRQFRAEALAEELEATLGRRYLLIRASRGREILAERLRAAGREVDQVVTYRSSDVEQPIAEIAAALAAGEIDWVTVTSSAIARSLAALLGDQLRQTKLASISPVTSATLVELGFPPTVEAAEYTMAGLVEAILRADS